MQATTLNRETFQTSREMDFFSRKELTTQTGHDIEQWPLVIVKELIDNALDACEEADQAPAVTVTVDGGGISVADNGPGIPEETVAGQLDFTIRASSREAYVAPDRGAQGNALKTLFAMPFVLDPEQGKMTITACGIRHEIVCRADPISQRAVVQDVKSNANGAPGTSIRIQWGERCDEDGDIVWPFSEFGSVDDTQGDLLALLRGYTLFNPHLSLSATWFDESLVDVQATDVAWKKWRPNKPTNALWYEQRHMERLIAAYITLGRDRGATRTVADFLKDFDGLAASSKRKQIIEATGLARVKLDELATDDGLKSDVIAKLLTEMKSRSKAVKPARLGIIGKDHFQARLVDQFGADPGQFEYTKIGRVEDGMPFIIESAFAWLGDDAPNLRHIFTGANWSSAIVNPFRSFGETGVGLEHLLSQMEIGPGEPVVFALHLAHPRVEYTDRGKSAIVIGSDGTEAGLYEDA